MHEQTIYWITNVVFKGNVLKSDYICWFLYIFRVVIASYHQKLIERPCLKMKIVFVHRDNDALTICAQVTEAQIFEDLSSEHKHPSVLHLSPVSSFPLNSFQKLKVSCQAASIKEVHTIAGSSLLTRAHLDTSILKNTQVARSALAPPTISTSSPLRASACSASRPSK